MNTEAQSQTEVFQLRTPEYQILNSTKGFTLIELIGVMAIMATLAAVIVPNVIQQIDAATQDAETLNLAAMGQGVMLYLRDQHAWPADPADLSPGYVPFGAVQLTQNHNGFPRYMSIHPDVSAYNNVVGLASTDLPDTRFLLISDLRQDAAVVIATAADFDTWWNTDETVTPNLKIHRGHIGSLFHLLSLSVTGVGGSYSIDGTATSSGGAMLALHGNYHLIGTTVGLDEANTYATPEIQFSLAIDAGYQFQPSCAVGAQWSAFNVGC